MWIIIGRKNGDTSDNCNKFVQIMDTASGEIIYNGKESIEGILASMSPDGEYLAFAKSNKNTIALISVSQDKKLLEIKASETKLGNISFTSDSKYISIYYVEGITEVFSKDGGESLGKIPGRIMSIKEDEKGDLIIKALYNNVASFYKNFEIIIRFTNSNSISLYLTIQA